MLAAALLVLALAVPVLASPAAAQSGNQGGDGGFVARQDGDCVELAVLGDGSRTVEEFYDYRQGGSWGFSSHGTTELQQTGTSQVFAYRGSNGTSLVVLHDEHGDDAGGGGVTMTVRGLPNGSWAVLDDQYPGSDDRFRTNRSPATLHWMYAQGRTDGAAYRGLDRLGRRDAIRIDVGYGRSSYAGVEANWPWVDDRYEWQIRYGSDPNALEPVDRDAPLRIERGSCRGPPPEQPGEPETHETALEVVEDGYRLSVDRAEVGDTVVAGVSGQEDARLRAVELELARDVEEWTVVWEREDAPDDLTEGVDGDVQLVPEEGVGPVRRVQYDLLALDPGEDGDGDETDDEDDEAGTGSAAGPTDVGIVERRPISWVVAGATVTRSDGALHASAASDALRPISLARGVHGSSLPGAPAASGGASHGLQLTALTASKRRVSPGETVELTATFENADLLERARNVTVSAASEPIEEVRVDVPPGARRNVTVSHAFERAGTYTLSVGNETRTVTVETSAVGGLDGGSGGSSWLDGLLVGAVVLAGLLASVVVVARWATD